MNCKLLIIVILSSLFVFETNAQVTANTNIRRYLDVTTTFGKSQGVIAFTYGHNWKLGLRRKAEIGISARLTNYLGSNKDFITAPARLARTSTIPFLIFFAGQNTLNQDTLTVKSPLTSSLNLALNAGYHISPSFYIGFNIDLIGFTIGRKTSAELTADGVTRKDPVVKPAAFNLLLTGDHDLGSLNSEFFIQYNFKKNWGLKVVYEFVFIEYKTQNIKQTAPDGTMVDRFRNKANLFGLGLTHNLNK